MPAVYARCRVVGLASRPARDGTPAEGAPLALLEAMAHARPVVAPDEAGIAEIVGDAGALVGDPTPAGFAEALAPYLRDRERAVAAGNAGRARVRERFTIDRMVAELQARVHAADRGGEAVVPRILMVIRAGEGGAFRHVADLSGGARGARLRRSPSAGRTRRPTSWCRCCRSRCRGRSCPGSDARAALGFARIVRDFRPDIVHAHGNKAGVVARLAHFARPGTPVIYSPHGYAFAGHFPSREQTLYRTLESLVAPLATLVLCVCEAEARLARATGINSRIRVVHNGIVPLEPASEATSNGGGPRICATSGLRPGKGLDALLEAMVDVVEAVPEVRLALAGDGPERDYLEAVAICNGVGDAVEWLGNLDDVIPLLSSSDVFVNPSWSESFPYSILEAMAVGCPILATDVGGVSEAIEDEVTGILVPPRDRVALAGSLIGLLGASAHAHELGRRARERQRAAFTLERMVAGTIAVYDEVLSTA